MSRPKMAAKATSRIAAVFPSVTAGGPFDEKVKKERKEKRERKKKATKDERDQTIHPKKRRARRIYKEMRCQR